MKIAIAHAAWIPERRETLRRLVNQLREDVLVSASPGPEHASIWSRRIWEWAAQQDEHVCFLNDDVLVHPEFRRICEAMIEALPGECISLHTTVPGAVEAGAQGHPWVRCYWLTGPAYILPPEAIRSLLAWLYRQPWYFVSRNNEDNLAIHWAWERQRPFWCAIPAPVVHDTATASTLGYDHHPWRVPTVPWADFPNAKLTEPSYWRVEAPPPLVENPWLPTAKLDFVRRVMGTEGHQLCHFCMAREGVVSANANPRSPRLCHVCLAHMYTAAVQQGQARR